VWIDKSLQKLAEFVPARYAKPEETSGIISSLDTYVFALDRPAPPAAPVVEGQVPVAETTTEVSAEQVGNAEAAPVTELAEIEVPIQVDAPTAVAEPVKLEVPIQADAPKDAEVPAKVEEPAKAAAAPPAAAVQ
jgi:hypothetical protein